ALYSNQPLSLQAGERLIYLALGKGHDGIAVGLLVTGYRQSVQRQGVVLGRGKVFFYQATQYTRFYEVESWNHRSRHPAAAHSRCYWVLKSYKEEHDTPCIVMSIIREEIEYRLPGLLHTDPDRSGRYARETFLPG